MNTMCRAMTAMALAAGMLIGGAARGESLYVEQSFRSLVSDNKAHRVGDVLTVQILENSTAASSADTSGQRKNALGFDFSDALRKHRAINLSTTNDFDGSGSTQRTGRLLAQITVTVIGVEPDGDLRIKGDQLLEINREQQKIRLEGRVRPQDINDSNTVASTRVADARISYVGNGDVASRAQPSWWNTFVTWLGF